MAKSMKYPVEELVQGMIMEENVYGGKDIRTPLVAKGAVITNRLIRMMKDSKIVAVRAAAPAMRAKMIEVPIKPFPVSAKLRRDTLDLLTDIFTVAAGEAEDSQPAANADMKLNRLVGQLVSALSKDSAGMINVNEMKSQKDYVFHHSLSVAVLSIAIAKRLGMSENELLKVGKCALIHDIGKSRIPVNIINKSSKLDQEEYMIAKTHAPEGYSYLSRKGLGDEELWEAVICHHERMDGSGYPAGIWGNRIPMTSRIIAVADVYDAMTSSRPYRKPVQPLEVMEFIMGSADNALDYDVVSSFLNAVEPYPVGSLIGLSNGKIASVIDCEYSLRPVIQMLDNGDLMDLYNDRQCLDLVIENLFPDPPAEV